MENIIDKGTEIARSPIIGRCRTLCRLNENVQSPSLDAVRNREISSGHLTLPSRYSRKSINNNRVLLFAALKSK